MRGGGAMSRRVFFAPLLSLMAVVASPILARADACYCGDAVSASPPSAEGCDDTTKGLFVRVEQCACESGPCAGVCIAAGHCADGLLQVATFDPTVEIACITCLQDTALDEQEQPLGCGIEIGACNEGEP